MIVLRFVPLAIVFCLVSGVYQQSPGRTKLRDKPEPQAVNSDQPITAATSLSQSVPKGVSDKDNAVYRQKVLQKFVNEDFAWIEQEASNLRVTKERLPGGYWKLRVLYDALEQPQTGAKASDGDWETQITKIQGWINRYPNSITARVALAVNWKEYAWKARGSGRGRTVTDTGWELFNWRLATAARVLSDAAALEEKCPHWFLISLWIGIGQSSSRVAFERVFEEAVKLEPTYYYLYQAKATYLLPRWFGEEGEWERFADESTLKVGGHEGDIIFFAVYSQMMSLHDINFMITRRQAWTRLLAGFRSLEKVSGESALRLNEACFFAFGAGDFRTAVELFDRIGEDYDQRIWRSKFNFEMFRRSALARVKAESEKPKPTPSQGR